MTPVVGYTSMPSGKVSVNVTLCTALGEPTGLVRSICSSEGWPADTLTGLKLLLMPMARLDTLDSVAVTATVFCAPSAVVIAPMGSVLVQLAGLLLVWMLKRTSQLAPAASVAPVIVTTLLPGAAVMTGEPAQVVDAAAGFATAMLVIGPSVNDRLVNGVDEGLVMRSRTCDTPPLATGLGLNVLVAVRPEVTVSVAAARAGLVAALVVGQRARGDRVDARAGRAGGDHVDLEVAAGGRDGGAGQRDTGGARQRASRGTARAGGRGRRRGRHGQVGREACP